jgi:translation elongation factor EF-Tu-like GTPase
LSTVATGRNETVHRKHRDPVEIGMGAQKPSLLVVKCSVEIRLAEGEAGDNAGILLRGDETQISEVW